MEDKGKMDELIEQMKLMNERLGKMVERMGNDNFSVKVCTTNTEPILRANMWRGNRDTRVSLTKILL